MYGGYCDGYHRVCCRQESKGRPVLHGEIGRVPRLPAQGYGRQLIDAAVRAVKEAGGRRISIGIINENTVLKEWYKSNGFTETEIKEFPHLPFSVCYLERIV